MEIKNSSYIFYKNLLTFYSTSCRIKMYYKCRMGLIDMNDIQMGVIEARFADIIWENEPISSGELAKKSEAALGWKKTTSFTVLKRLCDKGIFKNDGGTVTSLISREDYYSIKSEKFVEESFDGSLPAFLAAFTSRKKLSEKEIEQLRKLIDDYSEG